MSDPRPTLDVARRRAAGLDPLGAETVPLGPASGRRLVEPVTAPLDLPHYASSAMDGWAVVGPPPWTVRESGPVGPGECVAIVTGGAVPQGADAILRSERAERIADTVRPAAAARPDEPRRGEHIRPVATEARRGEELIGAGTLLTPAHVALAASAGLDRLVVARRPTVGLVLTGDEVTEAGLPGPGRVRDTFGPVLPEIVAALGGVVVSAARAADDPEELGRAIAAVAAEVVVTTGGTGSSGADHLRGVLTDLGAESLIDGVRMRPGGPTVLARLPGGTLLLGLPGNPLAALTALVVLGGPLLARLGGGQPDDAVSVTVAERIDGRADTTLVVPYRSAEDGAHPVTHRGAAMLRGLAAAEGLLLVPDTGAAPGSPCAALLLPWSRT